MTGIFGRSGFPINNHCMKKAPTYSKFLCVVHLKSGGVPNNYGKNVQHLRLSRSSAQTQASAATAAQPITACYTSTC